MTAGVACHKASVGNFALSFATILEDKSDCRPGLVKASTELRVACLSHAFNMFELNSDIEHT